MQYRIAEKEDGNFYVQRLIPALKIFGITLYREYWQNVTEGYGTQFKYVCFYTRKRAVSWIADELRKKKRFAKGDIIEAVAPEELTGRKIQ